LARWNKVWRILWEYLQEASGERDYDHYLTWAKGKGITPLSRDDFFLARMESRYSRPNRCC
jgi:uncharacterized short protein YbdD (DUF466 family)